MNEWKQHISLFIIMKIPVQTMRTSHITSQTQSRLGTCLECTWYLHSSWSEGPVCQSRCFQIQRHIEFSRAGVQRTPQTGGLKQQTFIVPDLEAGSQEEGVGRIGSSWGREGELVPDLSSSFWWLLVIFGIPWLWEAPPYLGLCLCVSLCPNFSRY